MWPESRGTGCHAGNGIEPVGAVKLARAPLFAASSPAPNNVPNSGKLRITAAWWWWRNRYSIVASTSASSASIGQVPSHATRI
jgi:hypothetical protein